ncbi:hypothetical protein J122_3433 [Marinobacter excellens LAMA 842]|jgi:hypothetical protein|uniref:Uncharacterized protein n=1 Tax=Marinobacter excellens LAMA 842 TaxID=1306954 RepID=A0A137S4I1_9GAMM|nr:hypothetical protein J122_3433 [Marinobacter excellens LAMA 842]|tara:strand:+ start:2371 stop:2535 length:165 start_codon:yes stop_codon:yes gene_type:complete
MLLPGGFPLFQATPLQLRACSKHLFQLTIITTGAQHHGHIIIVAVAKKPAMVAS